MTVFGKRTFKEPMKVKSDHMEGALIHYHYKKRGLAHRQVQRESHVKTQGSEGGMDWKFGIQFSSVQFSLSWSFPMSQLFTTGGQSIGVLASASVLPMNIQD